MDICPEIKFAIPSKIDHVKKLFILLLVYSSMGFTAVTGYKSTEKSTKPAETPVYGYIEVSSPSANSITLSSTGN
jgi:hypothetical protein